jgi:hypothetical protein
VVAEGTGSITARYWLGRDSTREQRARKVKAQKLFR